jgi:hypothetical protein
LDQYFGSLNKNKSWKLLLFSINVTPEFLKLRYLVADFIEGILLSKWCVSIAVVLVLPKKFILSTKIISLFLLYYILDGNA